MDQNEMSKDERETVGNFGDRLREAREKTGASLADIATQTRVPLRMLEALERADISALPAGPYATGFARSFARAVNLDENAIAAEIRALQHQADLAAPPAYDAYETADVSRVPPRALAWTAAGLFVLLAIAYLVWRNVAMAPDAPEANVAATTEASAPAASPPATAGAAGAPQAAFADSMPVSIRATGEVWFGLDDANGRRPFERTLKAGETYVLTPEQRALTLRTSRPQMLRIYVGNRALPQLGPDDLLVKNVGLDARSLTERANAPAIPAAGASATGAAAATLPATTTTPSPQVQP